MNLLLVNDDGIYAQGIRTLAGALSREHCVYVVAPHTEMSGTAHAVSFHRHLHYTRLELVEGAQCYALTGTPADCSKFGLEYLFADRKIDCVISGINDGYNLGSDVIYSGTVNAALEAAMLGVPAIAVSQADGLRDFAYSADFIARNLSDLCRILPADGARILSINIPSDRAEEIAGVRFVKVGTRKYSDRYLDEGLRGYRIVGAPIEDERNDAESDVLCAQSGYITVSPIAADCNDWDALRRLQGRSLCK